MTATARTSQAVYGVILGTAILLAGCSTQELQAIQQLPYSRSSPVAADTFPVDDIGIRLYERNGVRHIHPVAQAQYALLMLESWRAAGDSTYLELAELNATDLLANAHGDFLPYTFDFPLHGDETNTIHAPWYSAMAQGQFLSLAVRLAEETGDQFWSDTADRLFETLAMESNPASGDPWVVFRDSNGFLWFEEYAGDVEPMRVLNGHVFAMYGLYDYWRLTGSLEAQRLFWEGADTVDYYVPLLRVEGEPSWYGMRIQDNPIAQSERYHRIHIEQLRTLSAMTGESRFDEYADLLEADFS